jgi:HPt (histidine-containing phosphotransfer) domain-containing protein
MSSEISVLDHEAYVERRMQDADEAGAQIDALSAQAARRFMAIEEAVRRVRALKQSDGEETFPRDILNELLDQIANDLEKANQIRATDQSETLEGAKT